jgi:hypothetical protein
MSLPPGSINPPPVQPGTKSPGNLGSLVFLILAGAIGTTVADRLLRPSAPSDKELQAKRSEYMRQNGLDPDASYPFWPLVASEPVLENPDKADMGAAKNASGEWAESARFFASRRFIMGEVTNHGELEYSFVSATISLFDKGKEVDQGIETWNGLMPGKTWKYKMMLDYDGPFDSYKLSISGTPSTAR